MDELDLLNVIKDAGVIGALFVFVVGGAKKWWVWGHQYQELKESCDNMSKAKDKEIEFWQTTALRALDISEAVTGRR